MKERFGLKERRVVGGPGKGVGTRGSESCFSEMRPHGLVPVPAPHVPWRGWPSSAWHRTLGKCIPLYEGEFMPCLGVRKGRKENVAEARTAQVGAAGLQTAGWGPFSEREAQSSGLKSTWSENARGDASHRTVTCPGPKTAEGRTCSRPSPESLLL